jgi:hypothetical protein
MTKAFNLQDHCITVADIHRNLPTRAMVEVKAGGPVATV